MNITALNIRDCEAYPQDATWIYWENASRAHYGPATAEAWQEGLAQADRMLALGSNCTVELRRLEGRGWRGRKGTDPSEDAVSVAYAGKNDIRELRIDATKWVQGAPPPLRADRGVDPGSGQTVWLPFIAKNNG